MTIWSQYTLFPQKRALVACEWSEDCYTVGQTTNHYIGDDSYVYPHR
jgi:hypothetical protein